MQSITLIIYIHVRVHLHTSSHTVAHILPGGAGKARTERYLFFTLICVFTVIVSLYIPGVYFLKTFDVNEEKNGTGSVLLQNLSCLDVAMVIAMQITREILQDIYR